MGIGTGAVEVGRGRWDVVGVVGSGDVERDGMFEGFRGWSFGDEGAIVVFACL